MKKNSFLLGDLIKNLIQTVKVKLLMVEKEANCERNHSTAKNKQIDERKCQYF